MQRGFSAIIILLMVVLVGGAFILSRQTSLFKAPSQVVPVKNLASVSPAPSLASDLDAWQVYTDPVNKFSVKYPKNWFIKDMTKVINAPNVANAKYLNDANKIDLANYKISLTVDKSDIESLIRFLNYGDAGLQNKAEIIKTNISGREVIKALVTGSEFNNKTGEMEITEKNYELLIPLSTESTLKIIAKSELKETLDKMLSTFKFN